MIKTLRREKGMVLLLVLVVVALLTSLLTELAFSTLVDLRLTETFRDSTRAYYLAKGGIRVGRYILMQDINDYDARNDPAELWSQGLPNFPVGDGMVSIQAEDLGGKLELNRLIRTGGINPNTEYIERFIRLLELLGRTPQEAGDLAAALVDWIDNEQPPQVYQETGLGAEETYYFRLDKPHPIKNGPLDNLEELLLVKDFTSEIVGLLRPHVTAFNGDLGKAPSLNVNTASIELLQAWDPDMTLALAEAIIQGREGEPFKNTEDLKNVIGVNGLSILNRYTDIGFRSDIYRIESRAWVNDGARYVEAVVQKSGNKLLYLKVN